MIILLWLKKSNWVIRLLNLKFLLIESVLLSIRTYFSKGYTDNWSKEIFVIDSVLKNSPQTNKQRNKEKLIGSFYEK